MNIREKVKNLPQNPGVYFMKDSLGNVIYIGKSNNLRKRVSQYFCNTKNSTPKIVEMINNIHSIDYIQTCTELDALILESRLIKEMKPRYNRKLKNVKGYPYIRITQWEEYPRVLVAIQRIEDGSTYFGPFTSLSCVERVVDLLKQKYPIRKCSISNAHKKSTPCLNYHLNKCLAVCSKSIHKNEYKAYIDEIIQFLKGNNNDLVVLIEKEMEQYAKEHEYAKAAKCRDDLFAINHVINKQKIISSFEKKENILVVEGVDRFRVKIYLIEGSIIIHDEVIKLNNFSKKELFDFLSCIVKKFINNCKKNKESISQENIDEAEIVFSYIRKNSDRLIKEHIPKKCCENLNDQHLNKIIKKLTTSIYSKFYKV